MTVVVSIDVPNQKSPVRRRWWVAAVGVCAGVLAVGCAGVKPVDIPASPPELRPGMLAGYLPRAALPDSLALLPPPPVAGSALQAADDAAYAATLALKGSARWAMAQRDNTLAFPAAADTFACTLGVPVNPELTPISSRCCDAVTWMQAWPPTRPKTITSASALLHNTRPVLACHTKMPNWPKTGLTRPVTRHWAGRGGSYWLKWHLNAPMHCWRAAMRSVKAV